MQTDIKKKQFALVAPCLARAKPTKLWAKQVVGSHLEHQSTPASPMLTHLHPTSGSKTTLEVTGTLPQVSTWGHKSGIMHKPQELLHLG